MDRKKLEISEPCPKNFDEMDGDGHRRFCDHCDKHVTNLSDLTKAEALELLQDNAASGLCVVYTYDRSNRVRFRDDLNFRRPSKSQLAGATRLLAAAAVVPLLVGLSGCNTHLEGSTSFKPIDAIIDAEKRFFDGVADLLGLSTPDQPDPYELTVGGLEPYPPEVLGEPMIDPVDLTRPTAPPIAPVLPPTPEHVDEVHVEMMGDIGPDIIEQIQEDALRAD